MKTVTIAALIAGQTLAAAPGFAAELEEAPNQQLAAFGGLRVRVPLDGSSSQRRIRAGLALAPALHTRSIGGDTRLRIGDGLELGLAENKPLRLSLAGRPVSRLGQDLAGPDGRRMGVSTVGWIAIGVGVAAVVVLGGIALAVGNSND